MAMRQSCFARKGEDPLGRARVGHAARHVEIEHGVDHCGAPRCRVCDQVADRVGRFVEERLDKGLRHDFLHQLLLIY
jgi:hypothetical protein